MYFFKVPIAHAQASLVPDGQTEILFSPHSSVEDSPR